MKHAFTLVYEIPDDLIELEPMMQRIGAPSTGAKGGWLDCTTLCIWFERAGSSQAEAIAAAKQVVADYLPEAKYLSVRISEPGAVK